jgi:hypothetical protein
MAGGLGGGIRLADSHLHHLQTAVGVPGPAPIDLQY